jgi:AAA family ATP:ADP antiporter
MTDNAVDVSSDAAEDRKTLVAAVTIAVAAGFLLGGYEFLRSTANTLFTDAYGKTGLPYIRAILPLPLIAILYGYGRLLSYAGPRRTLLITSLLSIVAIIGCYIAIRFEIRPARGLLFIVQESYVVLLIEQYWSFLNSRLGTASAKKLNGPICGVASLGAILGALAVARYSKQLGSVTMLIFGATAIMPAALLSEFAYRSCGEPPPSTDGDGAHKKDQLGIKLFGAHGLLALLLLIIVSTQVISTALDLSFQGQLYDAIPNPDARNERSGEIYANLNMIAAASQFVLSPILLRLLPIAAIHIAMPLFNAATCLYLFSHPSLSMAATAYIGFKAIDYSLFRSAKEILYIPFSFDVRYRAKELIDVWGYRFSKGGTSAAIAFCKAGGAVISDATYAMIAAVAAIVWLMLIIPATRLFRKDGE